MENFKINNYEDAPENRADAWAVDESELQFDLSNLSGEKSSEQIVESEQGSENFADSHEQNLANNFEEIKDIYSKIEQSGRDSSSVFEKQNDDLKITYFDDYGANFENFRDREGYTARPNLHKTEEQLTQEVQQIKAQPRAVSLGQKIITLGKAIGFQLQKHNKKSAENVDFLLCL